jgi:hypothetical protein
MPSNKRPRRLNYAVNKKWPKAWTKVSNAIKHYQKLEKRMAFEWETKWISNAFNIVWIKLKKYWINPNKI